MKCCVIGGTGFIGHHVVKLLVEEGREVVVIGRSAIPSSSLPAGVSYSAGDYGDKDFLLEALNNVDEIIDLTYSSIPKVSFEDPIEDIINILPSYINLFEVLSLMKIRKLIIVSSGGTVYGRTTEETISEDHPTNPISPYGIAKLVVEKYARMYFAIKGLPVVCVRPANAYGEGQKPFTGQGFIATVIASAFEGREIELFGKKGVTRDFIYVKDVAKGILKALKYGQPGSCYNIGTGVGTSTSEILQMLKYIGEPLGIILNVKYSDSREYDVPTNVLNSSKLAKDAYWNPEIPLVKGLKLTWEYLDKLRNKSN